VLLLLLLLPNRMSLFMRVPLSPDGSRPGSLAFLLMGLLLPSLLTSSPPLLLLLLLLLLERSLGGAIGTPDFCISSRALCRTCLVRSWSSEMGLHLLVSGSSAAYSPLLLLLLLLPASLLDMLP
jgi:hypothetical protein